MGARYPQSGRLVFQEELVVKNLTPNTPASSAALLKFTPPAQLNVFDFLFNPGEMPSTIPLGRNAPQVYRACPARPVAPEDGTGVGQMIVLG